MGSPSIFMSLLIGLLITLPEAMLNTPIILLLTGRKDLLKINKKNIATFILTVLTMTIFSIIARRFPFNPVSNMLVHILGYSLIVSRYYKMQFLRTLTATALIGLLIATIETSYVPFIIMNEGLSKFLGNILLLLLCSLPERIIQFVLILYLRKYFILFVLTHIHTKITWLFNISIITIVAGEFAASFYLITYGSNMQQSHYIFFISFLYFLLLVFNPVIFKLLYLTLMAAIINSLKSNENVVELLKLLETHIANKNIEAALEIIKLINKTLEDSRERSGGNAEK